jgi:integrase
VSVYVYAVRLPYAPIREELPLARRLFDARLDTRNARLRLRQRREPYWRAISGGLAIGYRKGAIGGTWVARHYSAEHGRRYQSIGTADDVADADGTHVLAFSDAQEAARKWFDHLARHDRGEVKRGPHTVRECVEEYLDWLQAHRKTAVDARYRADAHILPAFGEIKCDRLTTAQIQKWLRDLGNSPARLRGKKDAKRTKYRELNSGDPAAIRRRRSSANRILTILKAALNRAWRAGKIGLDEAWRRVQPFGNVDAARVRYLSIAEAKRLINAADPDFRQLVRGALQTGARYGELTRLMVADFNPDVGTVAIQQSKSGQVRHVVLTDEGAGFFRQLSAGRPGSALIFTKADGSAWLKSHQARRIGDACERAKITPPVSFHALRHSWASLSVMAGVPLLVVAKNLGHSDTHMVEKHYGHLASSYVADAIRAGAPRFGKVKPDNVSVIGR